MPAKTKTTDIDPLDITGRTYRQFAILLDLLEDPCRADELSIPQLISALKLLLAYDLSAIRKFAPDDTEEAGSAARKYEKAFAGKRGGRAKATLHVVAGDDDDPAA